MAKELKYGIYAGLLVMIGMLAGFKLKQSFSDEKVRDITTNADKFREAMWFVERNYVKETDSKELVDDAIKGMLEGLDPHSFYIPTSEMKEMDEQMSGSFEGIGIEFNIMEDTIYVVAPISGGPSDQLGIQSGDRIVKINEEEVAGIGISNSDVMKKLKGPKGTEVKVSILRRGVNRELDYKIVRDKIPLHSVDFSYMIEDNVGYMRVTRFASTTYQEFEKHLESLKSQGMKNLILDLRDNPGGYMDKAQMISDAFLPKGKLIVYTEGRIPSSKTSYRATSDIDGFEEGGLIVLMNYGSASASEIVAGAVQDWDRALIVGVRSFGKGLVQTQKPFGDGSALRLVISKYYTPSGRCIQKPYEMSTREYNHEIEERFESGEIYDQTKIDLPDSLKFKTNSGRVVYGGGGITPDFFIPRDTSYVSEYLGELNANGMYREFSFQYVDKHPELKVKYPEAKIFNENFAVSESLVKEFADFSTEKGVDFVEEDYAVSAELIDNYIKAFIGRRLHNDPSFFPVLHGLDHVIQKAIDLMPVARELQKTGRITSSDR